MTANSDANIVSSRKKCTTLSLGEMKQKNEKIVMLTSYDA